jgi:hypothetical protein
MSLVSSLSRGITPERKSVEDQHRTFMVTEFKYTFHIIY